MAYFLKIAKKIFQKLPSPMRVVLRSYRDNWRRLRIRRWRRRVVPAATPQKYQKRASIIVVTYGNEEFTIGCFDSLRRTISKEDEVIWVDNNSSKSSKNKVLAWLKKHSFPQLQKMIFNDRNAGFIGGNRLGFQQAEGKYIVLLNNDTIVAPRWLDNMLAVFEKEPDVGIVGAVSSSPHQWQGIDNLRKNLPGFDKAPPVEIGKPNFRSVAQYGRKLEELFHGQFRIMWGMITFFAAVISRDLINTIGFLDPENLYSEMGLCDDDDYSERTKEAGFKLALALDSFVYHYHRATFKTLDANYKKIQLENTQRFNERWGHRRKIPLDKVAENP